MPANRVRARPQTTRYRYGTSRGAGNRAAFRQRPGSGCRNFHGLARGTAGAHDKRAIRFHESKDARPCVPAAGSAEIHSPAAATPTTPVPTWYPTSARVESPSLVVLFQHLWCAPRNENPAFQSRTPRSHLAVARKGRNLTVNLSRQIGFTK
jgi:hypothetical protein